ncbi:MAG: TatD DNase family protein [Blastocatellia bacterium]|jgi:TatD DNase family protein|nr:TatD DNase family protein [Blastocatellia bacterium]
MSAETIRLIDAHCHVDLYPDYAALIEETEAAGIYTIAVTNTPSVFRHCLALTDGKRFIRTALGLHPQLVRERHSELALMSDLLGQTKYIGEVGLDFVTQDDHERTLQQRVFSKILEECADDGNKVLTIHSRRAAAEVVDMIGDSYPGKIILHWYSGSRNVLERAISYGFYFSINTSMINSAKGRELLNQIPRDRLLTESDGPFVKTNGRAARPSDMVRVIEGLSDILDIDRRQTARRICENFRCVLRGDG